MSAHALTAGAAASPKRPPAPLNGIHTPGLFATIDVVKNQPQLAAFQFRAKGDWLGGTHMQTTMSDFSGAGGEHSHKAAYTAEADHPAVLCGQDNGADAGRIRAARAGRLPHGRHREHRRGARRHAAFRDVLAGGRHGPARHPGPVQRGTERLQRHARRHSTIKGDAPEAKLREIVQQACARSAVLDILSNGVPITVETNT